jgi:N-acetylmuramoyl-L-alanine amidase
MTREELFQLINLKEELIAAGKHNRPGTIIKPSKITIHNTSNADPGANADMHSKFVRNTGYYILKNPKTGVDEKHWVSWHFTVDDRVAIKHIPLNEEAYHAGTKANVASLAIEICMYKGIAQDKANERGAMLAALLCYDLSLPLASVVTHQSWTKKNCPELLLKTWDSFIGKINGYLTKLKSGILVEPVRVASTDLQASGNNIPLCWTDAPEPSGDALTDAPILSQDLVQDGFNEDFLSSGTVVLPVLDDPEDYVFIHHQNMSIYFNKDRKLALYSACNYNKDALFEKVGRSNSFRDDTQIDSSFQLGKGFYSSPTLDISQSQNYFDRGHLIARRYNQWGDNEDEAKRGERDTYFHTNIHPQVKELNQDEWEHLESFIIEYGQLDVRTVSIIAGSLLRLDDPVATYLDNDYKVNKTIQIPIVYWKIVFYEVEGQLRKIGFLMSQRNRLKEIDFVKFKKDSEEFDETDPFSEIGDPLKTYIVKSSLIESETKINFTAAKELYDKEEPLEVVIEDNETSEGLIETTSNIIQYI